MLLPAKHSEWDAYLRSVRFGETMHPALNDRHEGNFRLSAVAMPRNKGRWEWRGCVSGTG